ncbi:hypothetical protein ACGF07_31920 [Kitasatospora sp. NPDC048194]|uniref:hypothetical protein n=1 Tax=Kitasatospora sp. NPDC048194 TaxID=3364045 RepID=UPI003714B5E1
MDETNTFDRLEAARALLAGRYSHESYVPALRLLQDAMAELGRASRPGDEPVPDEVLLAALTVLVEAREKLDSFEVGLVRDVRARGVSWDRVARAQNLRTRQSAETRAKRLLQSSRTGRGDVAARRAEELRERTEKQWAVDHAGRVREVAAQLLDSAEAWPAAGKPGEAIDHTYYFGILARRCAAEIPDPAAICETLASVRYKLAIASDPADLPVPTGPRAAEAEEARRAVVELMTQRRRAVDTVIEERARARTAKQAASAKR